MAASIDFQNLYADISAELGRTLTLKGVEFEFEWCEPVVAATNGKVYLRVTTPANKYTLVSFREIRHDQERGFYRQYLTFSGGTVSRTIDPVKLRGDSTVNSEATFEVITAPTVDVNDAFSAIPLWGVGDQGSKPGQGSGLNEAQAIRVIPPGVVVLLEFENNSAKPAAWYAYFKQFEVPPAALPETGDI
jgi:hypothetical protein